MSDASLTIPNRAGIDLNLKAINRYLLLIIAGYLALLVYALLEMPTRNVLLIAGFPLAVYIVTTPRAALYQFVLALFVQWVIIPSIPLDLLDISSLLLILAGFLDFFLSDSIPFRFPKLFVNYLLIFMVIMLCGLLGYWPELMIRRLISTGLLLLLFIAVYQLSRKISVDDLINLFFLVAVSHSFLVFTQFIVAGGRNRFFGFTAHFYDDQAMVALPIGLSLYLLSHARFPSLYLGGTAVIFGGLLATQSRAPIVFGIIACLFVIFMAKKQIKSKEMSDSKGNILSSRLELLVRFFLLGMLIAVTLGSGYFIDLIARFMELFSSQAEGTTVYRLILWKKAWMAFLDHPIFGVGPGGFYLLDKIYNSVHLTPYFPYLKGLGAHNVLLHYLADMGIIGGISLLALVFNQLKLSGLAWNKNRNNFSRVSLALYGWGFLFTLTTFIEAGWMWGQLSFLAVFFAALVSRHHAQVVEQ